MRVSVEAIEFGDPDRAGPDRDPLGPAADREVLRVQRAAVDARDGVVAVVGHPHRAAAVGDAERLLADEDRALRAARDVQPRDGVARAAR
jgi:hypothetical protein